MWDNSTSSNSGLNKCIQFFISTNCELQMPRCNTLHLEIFASITCQLKYLCSEIFKDSRCVNSCSCTYTLALLDGALQKTVDTTYWKLRTTSGVGGFSWESEEKSSGYSLSEKIQAMMLLQSKIIFSGCARSALFLKNEQISTHLETSLWWTWLGRLLWGWGLSTLSSLTTFSSFSRHCARYCRLYDQKLVD